MDIAHGGCIEGKDGLSYREKSEQSISSSALSVQNTLTMSRDSLRFKFFTKLYLKLAFHHLEQHSDAREMTTFMTSRRPVRFTLALRSQHREIFQTTRDRLFKDYEGIVISIDDFWIGGNTIAELRERTEKIEL